MIIVYGVTPNWYHRLKPSLRSLWEHNPEANVYLLTLEDNVPIDNVHVINVKNQTFFGKDCVNIDTPFSILTLLRCCYAQLIPEDKVIHLDADTIITDSLQELWETDLTGKYIAACEEWLGTWKPYGNMYFNIGVMVMNLKKIREDDMEPRMIEHINTQPMWLPDQDTMNLFFGSKIKPLPIRWNETFATGKTKNPGIVHYAGYPDWYDDPRTPRYEYLARYKA